jgi:type I restriction enzyme, S subunit
MNKSLHVLHLYFQFDEQRHIVAYLDDFQAKVNVLRELQTESGKDLSALMPSILDKAFKGEL